MKFDRWEEAAALFARALEQPADDRTRFVEGACGTDVELARRVGDMLRADALGSSLLDATPENLAQGLGVAVSTPLIGRSVGPYKLLEVLGAGGMGIVYLAKREDVGKLAALKLVAAGLASPERVARFLQERRLLAQLEHPYIARLLDAGVTEDGLPWLAMEYVAGQPLDVYCSTRHLSIDERLVLFERVCGAVAYAHQRLIVHRDLKPANILVGLDGDPRLVDFGIAKLLDPSTANGESAPTMSRAMTPQYASPEQVHDRVITTASDIYQLGALLFEILTAQKPHAWRTTHSITDPDFRVPKPSRVVSQQLGRQLSGDLDTIVGKATELEPQRRYQTAEQLAEDIRRHRVGLPVFARPADRVYRFRKFVGRHKLASGFSAAALVGLLAFAVIIVEQVRRVTVQRNRAEQVSHLLTELLASGDPTIAQGETITVASVLARGTERVRSDRSLDVEAKSRLLAVIADSYRNLGQLELSIALLTESVNSMRSVLPPDDSTRLRATKKLASWLALAHRRDSAAVLMREVLVAGRGLPGKRRSELAAIVYEDGFIKQLSSDAMGARASYEEALALYRAAHDSLNEGFESALVDLGYLAESRGDRTATESFWRQALDRRRARLGPNHSLTAKSMMDLSRVLAETNRLDEAEQLVMSALAIQRRVYTKPHPEVVAGLIAAARVLGQRGKNADEEKVMREALDIDRALNGSDSLALRMTIANLAGSVQKQGRFDEAAELHRRALNLYKLSAGPRHLNTGILLTNLAYNSVLRHRLSEAESLYRQALPILDSAWQGTRRIAGTLVDFSEVMVSRGNCRDADPLLRRVIAFPPPATKGPRLVDVHALRLLGTCLVRAGRFADAEPVRLEAYQLMLSGSGTSSPYTDATRRDLVSLYERWGRQSEAARYRTPPN